MVPSTKSPSRLCENFLYGFKAAPRAARAADSAGTAELPLRSRPAGLCRRPAGAKSKGLGPQNPRKSRSRGGFDKGTLAAAPSGLCGDLGRPPDRGQA